MYDHVQQGIPSRGKATCREAKVEFPRLSTMPTKCFMEYHFGIGIIKRDTVCCRCKVDLWSACMRNINSDEYRKSCATYCDAGSSCQQVSTAAETSITPAL
jgi:hypothetical protein